MSKLKIELDSAGIQALLKSPEIVGKVEEVAHRVCDVAVDSSGRSYEVETTIGAKRGWASVKATDAHSYYSNLKHNTLVKALGSVKE